MINSYEAAPTKKQVFGQLWQACQGLSRGACCSIGAPCDLNNASLREYAFSLLVDRVKYDRWSYQRALVIATLGT